MSENKNTPQEIDLIELFTNIGQWFGKWINTIFYTGLYFILRNTILFIICLLTGAVLLSSFIKPLQSIINVN
jgi:hypothetical protein